MMDEDISEEVAQLRYENLKLQDELKHLKEQTLYTEENLNSVYNVLTKRDNYIKSLEQQVNCICQTLKEKELHIESLEHSNENLRQLKQRLSAETFSLKEDLIKAKVKTDQVDALKAKEEEWKNAYAKIRQENCELLAELSAKSEEFSLCNSNLKALELQVKELEEEKAELVTMRDTLLLREKEERRETSDHMEWFLRKSPEWSKSQLNLLGQGDRDLTSNTFAKGEANANLREEILEVEVREKQIKIGRLENLLHAKEEEESELKKMICELKRKLEAIGLLSEDPKVDQGVDPSAFHNVYNHLIKLINWPEGQPGEVKPLTEVSSLAVVVKDGVQTTQPGSIRIVETISIASQTDPIKNLSPVSSHFRTFEKFNSNNSPSDSDEEGGGGGPLLFDRNDVRKGLQAFSDHKNCDLDMDIYKMFKTSDASPSEVDSPGEGSGLEASESSSVSDRDSNNSRDVNLNSKKFADCNLARGSREESERRERLDADRPAGEDARRGEKSPSGESGGEGASPRHGNLPPSQGNNAGSGNSPDSRERRKKAASVANSSTPKPGSTGTQLMSDLLSISLDGSLTEQESNGQTFLVSASTLGPSSSLTNEEIGKRFQDLSFAFKTDSMTIQNRLHLMKRRRDQAETNIENELKTIKAKLRSLQYLGLNSEFVNLMSDLKKQLDFVLNATVQLSSSAEGYGYAQHEERLLEFVTVMLQHVENVETLKNEASKILEKLKVEGSGPLPSTSLDHEDRMLRRRYTSAAVAAESASRRRASIAALPRTSSSISENGSDGRGSPWPLCGRPLLGKKLSFAQGSPSRSHGNGSPPRDEGRRDSLGSRHRTESRPGEGLMKDIEEFPERQPLAAESESPEDALDADSSNVDLADSSFHLRQLFESLEEIRRSSAAQESVGAVHCIRKIIEWNKLLISATRFRWPDNVLHYVPFYVTWYVVFVLALVFAGGLFTGINGCYTYSCCKSSLLWFGVLTFLCLTRRFYRFLLPLFFAFLLALILLFLWLTQILLPQLSNEETEKLLRRFGFALEIRYPHGPPPT